MDSSKQMNKDYIAILFIIGILVGLIIANIYHIYNDIPKTTQFEIVVSNVKDSSLVKARLDSLSNLKLENAILAVEKKNDGRFEVLTWSAVLILTLLAALAAFNFVASVAKVREIVDDEIDKKIETIQGKANNMLSDMESKSSIFENIIQENTDKFQELMKSAEKAHQKTIDYLTKIKSEND